MWLDFADGILHFKEASEMGWKRGVAEATSSS